jgi:hypothetical protein
MTEDQQRMAKALAAAGLFPGSNVKRFARDMVHLADHAPEKELTPPQHKYLCDSVIRFRRSIFPRDVVALAESMAPQGPPAP